MYIFGSRSTCICLSFVDLDSAVFFYIEFVSVYRCFMCGSIPASTCMSMYLCVCAYQLCVFCIVARSPQLFYGRLNLIDICRLRCHQLVAEIEREKRSRERGTKEVKTGYLM